MSQWYMLVMTLIYCQPNIKPMNKKHFKIDKQLRYILFYKKIFFYDLINFLLKLFFKLYV